MTTTKTNAAILFIDSRESPSTKSFIANSIGVEYTQVIKLDCADFLTWDDCEPAHTCGIERKTLNDLMISLADGRVESQIGRMHEAYTHPILLIEGGALEMSRPGQRVTKGNNGSSTACRTRGGRVVRNGRETGWHHAAVQMLLLSLQRRYPRMAVVYTKGREETADFIRVVHQRARQGCFNGDSGDDGKEQDAECLVDKA